MNLLPSLLFAGNAAMVLLAAWFALRRLADAGMTRIELVLGWGLLALQLVVATGVLLGLLGQLGPSQFILSHLLILIGLMFSRGEERSRDVAELLALWREVGRRLRAPGLAGVWLGLLIAAALVLVVFGYLAQPVVFDALTYRLSRIGHWLQEGRVGLITTDDARLNYMPAAPDLVMAWLAGMRADGYGTSALAQTFGGLLALVATVGLGRLTALSWPAAIAAALLLLGLPNVAPQFTTAYTDLFTTGVLAAAFCLWLAALFRGRGSWLAGTGAGLALASKGTVIYFAPGLVPVVLWLAWRHRLSRREWSRTLLGGLLATAVFLGPSLMRNQRAYDGWAGPAASVTWHHGPTPGWRGSLDKLQLNLSSALAQLCEPNSQPLWWRDPVQRAGAALIRRLPEKDPYAFDDLNRRANLEKVYAVAAPDADVASTGVALPLLGLLAGITALAARQRAGRELALAWMVAIAGFVLFMHWRVQWHPYQFRFLVLASPWLAVLVVWGLVQWPRPWQVAVGTLLAAVTVHGLGAAWFDTYQSGWPAYARSGQSLGAHVYQEWRGWSAALDQPETSLRPALPMNLPLAAFFRQPSGRRVELTSLQGITADKAEDAIHGEGGWLIVPAAKFLGREGSVMTRVWLQDGEERNAFSLAAYRTLRPGEHPVPALYRNRIVVTADGIRRELLVKSWAREAVGLQLFNPGESTMRCTLQTPRGNDTREIAPGQRLRWEVALTADAVSPVILQWPKAEAGRTALLDVRLLP